MKLLGSPALATNALGGDRADSLDSFDPLAQFATARPLFKLELADLTVKHFEVIQKSLDHQPDPSGQFVAGVPNQIGYPLKDVADALGHNEAELDAFGEDGVAWFTVANLSRMEQGAEQMEPGNAHLVDVLWKYKGYRRP